MAHAMARVSQIISGPNSGRTYDASYDSMIALHALADSAKTFLSCSAVFKSIESTQGSKLVGDIWTYLLETNADPLLVGLILEALEGQERAAGSGYEWSVCLAAFIVKRLMEHDAPIPDILQLMHEGLSACHEILTHSSIGSEELPSAIKEDDLQIYITAIEHHQAGTAKAHLFLTDDLEDELEGGGAHCCSSMLGL
jgi:hypothetical protein